MLFPARCWLPCRGHSLASACGDRRGHPGHGGRGLLRRHATARGSSAQKLSGTIVGDGSSTVFPITEAVAEEFGKVQPGVKVSVGISGTGGGFKKFCNGETDFNDASRPITDAEKQACADKGIEYIEFEVAYDGLAVVVNKKNDFAQCLTVPELKSIWETGSTVKKLERCPRRLARQADQALRPGHRLRHLRLLHRSHHRRGEEEPRRLHGQRRRQRARPGYRGRRERARLLRFRLLRGEQGQAEAGGGRRRQGRGCVPPSHETILNNTYHRCRGRSSSTCGTMPCSSRRWPRSFATT